LGSDLGASFGGTCATAVPAKLKLSKTVMQAWCITRVMHNNG